MRLRITLAILAAAGAAALLTLPAPVQAYVEAPHSLGQVVQQSTNIVLMRVDKVDKAKRIIIYTKIRDIKGKHPQEVIKHNLQANGFHEREWKYPMDWAEVGKTAVFCHNGGASETCIGTYWYQAYAGGEWWNFSHGEPFLCRSFAGKPEKLAAIAAEMLTGKEVLAPCMVDSANKDDLHLRRAKIQRLKVSLKLQDYNPKRDFAGWGDEDFRRLSGLPGFTHYSGLTRVDPDAQSISAVDLNGDGKMDLCLVGAQKVALLQNDGEALGEVGLPGAAGGRAGVWADYNGDGKPDLLLASATGPKLYTNLGTGFRDDSHLLPNQSGWNLTSAAWIDQDGDGKPDILLGNGFHGLRLYGNKGMNEKHKDPIRMGNWYFIGPFDNAGQQGFNRAYPPEQQPFDVNKKYPGKRNVEVAWQSGKFTDGQVNNLALFQDNNDSVVYLHREIECAEAMDLPVSLGSDDTLTVWLNGQKLLAENVYRGAAPDQNKLTLKLKAGSNKLLLKICQGTGDWSFYFQPSVKVPPAVTWLFEDVSDRVGLGEKGIGSTVKGDTLTVADVNGDGRPDFLYGAGTGTLVLNTEKGFVEAPDHGINYRTGRVGPVFADFDNDGHLDLFVPQNGTCKLFRGDGKGRFTDVTEKAGDLSKAMGQATSAAWGDFDNDGKLDLVVGCLKGSNRFFRNKGNGVFEDATAEVGLSQRIFNTQAICLVDLNGDGILDMVFNNEGQESCVLLGNPEWGQKLTPLVVSVKGKDGVLGSKVRVLDKDGKLHGSYTVSGGEGRGGQSGPTARFALKPGTYRVEVQFSTGVKRMREVVVATSTVRGVIDETTPQAQ